MLFEKRYPDFDAGSGGEVIVLYINVFICVYIYLSFPDVLFIRIYQGYTVGRQRSIL